MPGKSFYDGLPTKTQMRLKAWFEHVANFGERDISKRVFRHERGEIYTFKCKLDKRRIRLPCFRIDDRWILTHGFFKVGGAWEESDFKLATEIMNEVLAREQRT